MGWYVIFEIAHMVDATSAMLRRVMFEIVHMVDAMLLYYTILSTASDYVYVNFEVAHMFDAKFS